MKPSSSNLKFERDGFFQWASLDSNKAIHLATDTLYVNLSGIWSFSNCALQSIDMDYEKQDSILWISPTIKIRATEEECPSPFSRPDTVLKLVLDKELLSGIGQINVRDDRDSTKDTIRVRHGFFEIDTFLVYMDSSFANPRNYPLRTKETRNKKPTASVLAVLDSLVPRKLYWRTMKSSCTNRVDMCDDVVADTLFPASWNVTDTNLVPVRLACADTNLVYCINSKWKDDSTALGKLQERPDTIWYSNTYYVEKIPQCATFDGFFSVSVDAGSTAKFIRRMFVPDEDDIFCGPASTKDMMFYSMLGKIVTDSDSVKVVDKLLDAWENAQVAPDTLISKD